MTEPELDLLQELLTERMLRLRLQKADHRDTRQVLDSLLGMMRIHYQKPFEITEEQTTEVVQAANIVLRHVS